MDYVHKMPDDAERERVLQAMHDAEHILADTQIIDDIEARYGDGAGGAAIA